MKDDYPFPSSRLLALASEWQHDETAAIHSANYRTAAQLALDGNLPGDVRREYITERNLSAWMLASRLLHLTRAVNPLPDRPNFF